jgi:hypothetical protein
VPQYCATLSGSVSLEKRQCLHKSSAMSWQHPAGSVSTIRYPASCGSETATPFSRGARVKKLLQNCDARHKSKRRNQPAANVSSFISVRQNRLHTVSIERHASRRPSRNPSKNKYKRCAVIPSKAAIRTVGTSNYGAVAGIPDETCGKPWRKLRLLIRNEQRKCLLKGLDHLIVNFGGSPYVLS